MRLGAERLDEKVDLGRIARDKKIRLDAPDHEDPTELPHEITVLSAREHVVQRVAVCEPLGLVRFW